MSLCLLSTEIEFKLSSLRLINPVNLTHQNVHNNALPLMFPCTNLYLKFNSRQPAAPLNNSSAALRSYQAREQKYFSKEKVFCMVLFFINYQVLCSSRIFSLTLLMQPTLIWNAVFSSYRGRQVSPWHNNEQVRQRAWDSEKTRHAALKKTEVGPWTPVIQW